ncbi:1-phosphofructokinase family hexose kinase, partial [Actinotalea sp. C106]|uniref:1-phosphofructokinase family hexose kinase n=1 Tax=Actinotalea sp. C106 TaxID=2908644 RepID=UPI0020291E8C
MIITVTLNPSLDRTVEVDDLVRGEVLRARGVHLHPGGKGVNVTRALLANGVASRAVLPVAGAEGDQLVGLLTAEAVDVVTVPVSGRTRSNVTIAEADGTVTKLNEPGPALDAADLDRLLDGALATVAPHGWVVLCGSLPPGVPTDHYAAMTRRAHQAGARVALDTSGPALVEALAAAPDLIKPNAEELAEAAGMSLGSRADVVEAA